VSAERLVSGRVIDAENPWPGLSSFDEGAQRFFSGRDAESAELLRLVGQAPLTVLFGKSGLGKTSLVQAGLFPRLRRQNILPIYVRLDVRDRSAPLLEQAAAALQVEVGAHRVDSAAPEQGQSLWEHLHGRHVEWWSDRNQPLTPVFVFDQFEEAFTLGAENADAIERLRLDMADLVENRIPADLARRIEAGTVADRLDLRGQRYKVLLSFREDFLPDVEGWKGELPSVMRNRLRLRPMSADRALQVVSGTTPTDRTHELVSDDTAREMVRFVAAVQSGSADAGRARRPGTVAELPWDTLEIEPALLSLVCAGLNDKRKGRGLATIDGALLEASGNAIIDDFYRECVADVPEKTRRFIEDSLITEGGFRNSYPLQDALDQNLITQPLLRQLVDRRLLRIDHQLGADRVELIHDRVTDAVRGHRDLQRKRIRARRQRRTAWATGAVGVFLLAMGGVFFSLWRQSKAAAEAATQALGEAVSGKLVMQSRAILEGQTPGTLDTALLLAVAGFRLEPSREAYTGLQYALNATPRLRKVVGFPERVAAVSYDGRTAATSEEIRAGNIARMLSLQAPSVRLWNLTTGAPLTEHGSALKGTIAFSPDGKMVASGSMSDFTHQTLRLWDVGTSKPRGESIEEDVSASRFGGAVAAQPVVAFSPDGVLVVSSRIDGTLRVREVATGQTRGTPMAHNSLVTSVAFSPDGKTIVSGAKDGAVRLWDTTGRTLGAPLEHTSGQGRDESVVEQTLGTPKRAISGVSCSPDGMTIASLAGDGTLRVWDMASGQSRGAPIQLRTSTISSMAFAPDGKTIVSGAVDGTLHLWDPASGQERGASLQAHVGSVTAVAFGADASLVSTGADKSLRVWDTDGWLGNVTPPQGHAGEVTSVAMSPDGQTIVSGGIDGTVRRWDAAGRARDAPLAGPKGRSTLAAFSPDGRVLAALSPDGTVRLWDAQVREPRDEPRRVTLRADIRENTKVALSPDGKTVAVTGSEGTLQVLDGATGEPRGPPWQGHDRNLAVSRLAFSPDGGILLSASYGQVRLWDVTTGKQRGRTMRADGGFVAQSLALSPDHEVVVSGTVDSLLLWDAATGRLRVPPIYAHGRSVTAVAFSPDGRTLVSGGEDATLRFWDVASGHSLGAPLQGPTGVTSVAFSPDGKTVVSGGDNGTLQVWDAPTVWVDRVCGRLARNLSPTEWKQYVGNVPYRAQCPALPTPER